MSCQQESRSCGLLLSTTVSTSHFSLSTSHLPGWNLQKIAGDDFAGLTVKRQFARPVHVRAVDETGLRARLLPAAVLLQSNVDGKTMCRVVVLLFPLEQRGFQFFAEAFGRFQTKNPVVCGVDQIGSERDSRNAGLKIGAVPTGDAFGFGISFVVNDQDFVAGTQRFESTRQGFGLTMTVE
jgi:hypothetical protein